MPVRLERPVDHPHVALVTIDRPAKANALDPPTLRELAGAWRRDRRRPGSALRGADRRRRARLLRGHGHAADDRRRRSALARGERVDPESFEGLRSVGTALLVGFDLGVPLVCAMNGHARARPAST